MDAITTGHWIFAVVGSGFYILYCLWGYKVEHSNYKNFDFKIFPTMLYMLLVLIGLIIIS